MWVECPLGPPLPRRAADDDLAIRTVLGRYQGSGPGTVASSPSVRVRRPKEHTAVLEVRVCTTTEAQMPIDPAAKFRSYSARP
jgi:hypothetical protein